MTAVYCFCFAPATALPTLAQLAAGGAGPPGDAPGGEAPVVTGWADCDWEDAIQVRTVAGLSVVLSLVPSARFTGPAAEQRLSDLAWLLPRVRAHDCVITRAMARTTVFPLRFATLFSSLGALAAEMADRRRTLLTYFAEMGGREEWAVKALLDQDQAVSAQLQRLYPTLPAAPTGAAPAAVTSAGAAPGGDRPSGRDYLLQQRRRGEAERALGPWLDGITTAIDTALGRHCQSLLARPATAPAVLNRACLLETGAVATWRSNLDALDRELTPWGLRLHCSGPWPLYSFCARA